jgi:hypothetical protein
MPVSASDAKEYFVDNVSDSAKNYILRDVFRSEQVGLYPYKGGFVCHRMFVEFAKASLLMNNGTPERSEDLKLLETDIKTTEEELDGLFGSLLSNGRTKKSLFSNDYPDEEAPQAALAAEMLRFALDSLKQKQQSRNESSGNEVGTHPTIVVSHQFPIIATLEGSVNLLQKSKRKASALDSESDVSVTSEIDPTKVDMLVDILCWIVRMPGDMGACCLASIKYEPSSRGYIYLEAQADMYASNIQILLKKPCLSIDILRR